MDGVLHEQIDHILMTRIERIVARALPPTVDGIPGRARREQQAHHGFVAARCGQHQGGAAVLLLLHVRRRALQREPNRVDVALRGRRVHRVHPG